VFDFYAHGDEVFWADLEAEFGYARLDIVSFGWEEYAESPNLFL
jgi:hypothetical protein